MQLAYESVIKFALIIDKSIIRFKGDKQKYRIKNEEFQGQKDSESTDEIILRQANFEFR